VIGFIYHLYTPFRSTSKYSAASNLSTLQITAANAKFSPARSVFNSCFLVTDINSVDSSVSRAQVLPVISRGMFLHKSLMCVS
jgi:hypothetical protein